MNSLKQIKYGAILSYLSIAVNIISGLLYTPWMIDMLGQSQYGLYTLANSLITLFMVDFGLSSATGRYLSKYNAEGDTESAECFLGTIYKLYLIIDAVIFLALIVVFTQIDNIYVTLTTTELKQFRVVYIISASFSIINFPFVTFNGILTAYERFIPLKVADVFYRVCNVGFTVIALLMGYGLYMLVTIHAGVGMLVLLFKYILIRKTIPIKPKFSRVSRAVYMDIGKFSLWMTIATVSIQLTINITPSILGMVANSTAIAVFGIVTTITQYTQTISTAINGMFMPRISKIMALGGDLNKLFVSIGKYQYALNGLILSGFSVLGKQFLSLWLGDGYSSAYIGILLLIIPGLYFNSLQIATTAMVVQNNVKSCAVVHMVTGIINVMLAFPLSKLLGMTGACLSLFVAYWVRNFLFHIIYNKLLPLDIPRFIKECYGRMSVPIVVTMVFGVLLNQCVMDSGWGIFLIKAGVIVVVYGISLFIFALDKKEREKALSLLKRK